MTTFLGSRSNLDVGPKRRQAASKPPGPRKRTTSGGGNETSLSAFQRARYGRRAFLFHCDHPVAVAPSFSSPFASTGSLPIRRRTDQRVEDHGTRWPALGESGSR